MTIPAGMEKAVIKKAVWQRLTRRFSRMAGRTGINMELPRTMIKGTVARIPIVGLRLFSIFPPCLLWIFFCYSFFPNAILVCQKIGEINPKAYFLSSRRRSGEEGGEEDAFPARMGGLSPIFLAGSHLLAGARLLPGSGGREQSARYEESGGQPIRCVGCRRPAQ